MYVGSSSTAGLLSSTLLTSMIGLLVATLILGNLNLLLVFLVLRLGDRLYFSLDGDKLYLSLLERLGDFEAKYFEETIDSIELSTSTTVFLLF